ncbi:acyl-CoA dehydrogenase [Halogeometricum pallidum JCM 14848]|uniref:Acyl-CoA dehydrogenase n=1 Tax=Halogeometricum pallidum JCM 14848 TaxID=1227487 RepID=M0CZX5_HALPD|nr:acyl-CoA dehydrogenase family protein [Halogeometricum pallidum]ELZ28765.1 acyl-CoA dehydrogenase [Halogeometricum pallidum JCM 14848]
MDLLGESVVPANAIDTKRRAQSFAREHVKPAAGEYFESGEYPMDVIEAAREKGLVAQEISKEYGGAGRSVGEAVATAEEFFRADAGIGLALMGQSFGTGILEQFGTEKQKDTYLRPIAAGEMITGMAISEPETGSDLAGMETSATKEGSEWVLNGEKYWIGNGVEADWILVYVCTEETDDRHDNHSLFIVPTDSDGYDAEHIPKKIGMHASKQSHITFENCRVPQENLVGERGEGFRMVAEFFNHGRTRVAAQGIGLAAAAIEEAWAFVHDREEFGRSVSDFQSVRHDLADMRTQFESARTLLWHAVERLESDEDAAEWAAMAKLNATETAADCAQTAIRLHGGWGVLDESRIGRIYRDVRMPMVYEGVSEIQRDIVYENFA